MQTSMSDCRISISYPSTTNSPYLIGSSSGILHRSEKQNVRKFFDDWRQTRWRRRCEEKNTARMIRFISRERETEKATMFFFVLSLFLFAFETADATWRRRASEQEGIRMGGYTASMYIQKATREEKEEEEKMCETDRRRGRRRRSGRENGMTGWALSLSLSLSLSVRVIRHMRNAWLASSNDSTCLCHSMQVISKWSVNTIFNVLLIVRRVFNGRFVFLSLFKGFSHSLSRHEIQQSIEQRFTLRDMNSNVLFIFIIWYNNKRTFKPISSDIDRCKVSIFFRLNGEGQNQLIDSSVQTFLWSVESRPLIINLMWPSIRRG